MMWMERASGCAGYVKLLFCAAQDCEAPSHHPVQGGADGCDTDAKYKAARKVHLKEKNKSKRRGRRLPEGRAGSGSSDELKEEESQHGNHTSRVLE